MRNDEEIAFAKFCTEHHAKLTVIAHHTRGEHSPQDVKNEAWLLLQELKAKRKLSDLTQPNSQTLLLKHLYQKLVRYTDKHVRFAERLEHCRSGGDGESDRSLAEKLPAAPSWQPLEILEARELDQESERNICLYESRAGALVLLLRRFDNNMKKMADHLLISISWCYQCYARARILALHQHPLRVPVFASKEQLQPRPWRKFRLPGRRKRDSPSRHTQQLPLSGAFD